MSGCDTKLRTEDLELLDILGAAAIDTDHIVPFECQPVDGWPFTWFLHPDIPDGARVADIQSCINLEAAGYIVFIHDDIGARRRQAVLTYNGIASYRARRADAARQEPTH